MPNKILIVDDEPFNLDLLEQELMEYDYVLERAVDGVDALAKADSFAPDIILLDNMKISEINTRKLISRGIKRLRSAFIGNGGGDAP